LSNLLTTEEEAVIDRLVEAWNGFCALDSLHPDELAEFRQAIHAVQVIVMARPVQRQFNAAKDFTTQ